MENVDAVRFYVEFFVPNNGMIFWFKIQFQTFILNSNVQNLYCKALIYFNEDI